MWNTSIIQCKDPWQRKEKLSNLEMGKLKQIYLYLYLYVDVYINNYIKKMND